MLRFITAGESHGKGLTVIVDGIPANLHISQEFIQHEMQKRSHDAGRGGRGLIEDDKVQIMSGVYQGKTIGSPITLYIENKDFKEMGKITAPRPGHADLAGILKYGFNDVRPVLERASARETAARVAAGAIFKQLLQEFQIELGSHTIQIGEIKLDKNYDFEQIKNVFSKDPDTRCVDQETAQLMKKAIDEARINKNTLGGIVEVWAVNVPPGLGSYIQYDKKIDGDIAQAMMSIPSVKVVEIGISIAHIHLTGSKFHDEIFYSQEKGYFRNTNHAGGIEGGITNGMPIIVRAYHKPISTLYNPLKTVDIITKKESMAAIERSDICIVPRAGVVAESMLAFVLAKNFLFKFGSDNLADIKINYQNYLKRINE